MKCEGESFGDAQQAVHPLLARLGDADCLQGFQVIGGLLVLADQVGDGALVWARSLEVFAFFRKKVEEACEIFRPEFVS
ncbi:MAG: hypothetical protein B0D91_11565 [Oceanospirillales bacterium LUC14_002_19_P2]|nr:MAG: hypothetical protein B0D91_11565 [Oceanospirillales bacterium LUC14_002_19_P2]